MIHRGPFAPAVLEPALAHRVERELDLLVDEAGEGVTHELRADAGSRAPPLVLTINRCDPTHRKTRTCVLVSMAPRRGTAEAVAPPRALSTTPEVTPSCVPSSRRWPLPRCWPLLFPPSPARPREVRRTRAPTGCARQYKAGTPSCWSKGARAKISRCFIYRASRHYRQSTSHALHIAHRESRFNWRVTNSSSGAAGLYQFMPRTWQSTPYRNHSPVPPQVGVARRDVDVEARRPEPLRRCSR